MNTQSEGFNTTSNLASQWLENSEKRTQPLNLARLARGIWERFVELFTPSTEIRIFTGRDRNGILYYRVYDVSTKDIHHFDSEDEVRIWLEQRYYH